MFNGFSPPFGKISFWGFSGDLLMERVMGFVSNETMDVHNINRSCNEGCLDIMQEGFFCVIILPTTVIW